MKINNIDIDFNLEYVDDMEKYEDGYKDFISNIDSNKQDDSKYVSKLCYSIRDFFYTLFGEETTDKILGERIKASTCLQSITDFFEQIAEQAKTFNGSQFNELTKRMLTVKDGMDILNKSKK